MTIQQAIASSALAIYESARTHKRTSEYHRRRAQELMRALDNLVRTAESLGIEVVVKTAEGETIHGRKHRPSVHDRNPQSEDRRD